MLEWRILKRLGQRLRLPLVLLLVFAGVVAFRFLSLDRFTNDQFPHLTRAFQTTLGDLPVRDYDTPGLPLAIVVSAAGIWAGGPTLFPEAVLSVTMLALAAAVTWYATARLARMPLLAWLATLLQVIAFPRFYSYPKILLHAAAPLAFLAYAERPTNARLLGLALLTEVGLLFRHDHAIYLAGAVGVLLVLVHGMNRTALSRLARYGGWCVLLSVPYLVYVQWAVGIGEYLSAALSFSRAEALRTASWGSLLTASAGLALAMAVLPLAVLLRLGIRWVRNRHWDETASAIAATAVLLLLINMALLREPTAARLADVFGPAPVLLAWMAAQAIAGARTSRLPIRAGARVAVAAAAVALFAATAELGALPHQIRETRVLEGWSVLREHAAQQVDQLQQWPWTGMSPNPSLDPLVRYLDACTEPDTALFVVGFIPELPFFARRPIAGGQTSLMPGYYTTPAEQSRMLQRLQRRPPAFVAIDRAEPQDVLADWPAIEAFIRTRYRTVDGALPVHLLIARGAPIRGHYKDTGLPCLR